ncbi:hypothetical protein [Aquimarina latercula]|uniref:hypothetical protein n=1 Tax=Aquimarina latercula TaxID=987 RepID=UPI000488DDD1|nr:hypothetical protein [Aquimarina latercula]
MKKTEKKSDSLFNNLDVLFESIEGLMFGTPYLIMTSMGTLIKVLFLSFISLVMFNQLIKLKKLWSKEYLMSNIVNPWNCVVTIIFFIALFNLT